MNLKIIAIAITLFSMLRLKTNNVMYWTPKFRNLEKYFIKGTIHTNYCSIFKSNFTREALFIFFLIQLRENFIKKYL